MARRRSFRRFGGAVVRTVRAAPATIRLQMPRFAGAAKHHGRRALRRVGAAAYEQRHRMGAFVGAAILGFIDKQGFDIPVIPVLGKAGTIAVAAFAAEKWGKMGRWAGDLCTAAGAIAIYEYVTKGSVSGGDGFVAGV